MVENGGNSSWKKSRKITEKRGNQSNLPEKNWGGISLWLYNDRTGERNTKPLMKYKFLKTYEFTKGVDDTDNIEYGVKFNDGLIISEKEARSLETDKPEKFKVINEYLRMYGYVVEDESEVSEFLKEFARKYVDSESS